MTKLSIISPSIDADIKFWDEHGVEICEHVRSKQEPGYQWGPRCFACVFAKCKEQK